MAATAEVVGGCRRFFTIPMETCGGGDGGRDAGLSPLATLRREPNQERRGIHSECLGEPIQDFKCGVALAARLDVGDGRNADPSAFGELSLGQAGGGASVSESEAKR